MEIEVGDIVRIVDKPQFDCKAGWLPGMTRYYCLKAVVTSKYGLDMFLLNIDGNCYVWSDDVVTDVREAEFDMKGFSELLRL